MKEQTYTASQTPMIIILIGAVIMYIFGQFWAEGFSTPYKVFLAFIILIIFITMIRKNVLTLNEEGIKEIMGGKMVFNYKWDELTDFKIEEVSDLETICFKVISQNNKKQSITNIYKIELNQLLSQIEKYKNS